MSTDKPKPKKRGAPTGYKPEIIESVAKLAKMGMSNVEIAEFLGKPNQTFSDWIKKYPELSGALARARLHPTGKVVAAMYKNALGAQTVDEIYDDKGNLLKRIVRTKEPNQAAIQFWLKNRDPNEWREKQHIEHSGGVRVYDVEPLK